MRNDESHNAGDAGVIEIRIPIFNGAASKSLGAIFASISWACVFICGYRYYRGASWWVGEIGGRCGTVRRAAFDYIHSTIPYAILIPAFAWVLTAIFTKDSKWSRLAFIASSLTTLSTLGLTHRYFG